MRLFPSPLSTLHPPPQLGRHHRRPRCHFRQSGPPIFANPRLSHLRQSAPFPSSPIRATPEPPSPTTAPVYFLTPSPTASVPQPAPEAAEPDAAAPDAAPPEVSTNEDSEPVQSSMPPSDASTIPPAPPFSKYLPSCTFKVFCRFCFRDNHDICYRQCPTCYKKRGEQIILDGDVQDST